MKLYMTPEDDGIATAQAAADALFSTWMADSTSAALRNDYLTARQILVAMQFISKYDSRTQREEARTSYMSYVAAQKAMNIEA